MPRAVETLDSFSAAWTNVIVPTHLARENKGIHSMPTIGTLKTARKNNLWKISLPWLECCGQGSGCTYISVLQCFCEYAQMNEILGKQPLEVFDQSIYCTS